VILAATRDEDYSVAVDAPFAGALVPPSAYRMDRRALSVMIGVNKRLYMDEHSGAKTEGFGKAHTAVGRLIMLATEATAREAPTPHGALG
jgi:N-formylglutamate deformylase